MTSYETAQAIMDLAEARLRDERITDPNVRHDLGQIVELARQWLWGRSSGTQGGACAPVTAVDDGRRSTQSPNKEEA